MSESPNQDPIDHAQQTESRDNSLSGQDRQPPSSPNASLSLPSSPYEIHDILSAIAAPSWPSHIGPEEAGIMSADDTPTRSDNMIHISVEDINRRFDALWKIDPTEVADFYLIQSLTPPSAIEYIEDSEINSWNRIREKWVFLETS